MQTLLRSTANTPFICDRDLIAKSTMLHFQDSLITIGYANKKKCVFLP